MVQVKISKKVEGTQTQFGESVAFTMRAFRFVGESATEQLQTISCSLHLKPIGDIQQQQASDCTCHTEEECIEPVFGEWAEWSDCSVTCATGERTRSRQCTGKCTNIDDGDFNHRLTEMEACEQSAC